MGSAAKMPENKEMMMMGMMDQNYQGHFLEDLSEADISNNSQHKYVNQTDDGEMIMFNNKT